MVKPIKIQIQKKRYVERKPEKKKKGYTHRADYHEVGMIGYEDSIKIFNSVDNRAPIITDGQFAKMLHDNYGEGEYLCIAWIKGRSGFYNFMHVVCFSDGRFKRVEKRMSQDEKQARDSMSEIRRLKKRLLDGSEESDNTEIKQEIEDLKEDLDFNKEIVKIEKEIKRGPYPYLKSIQPVYREHYYDDIYFDKKSENIVGEEAIVAEEAPRWV